MKTEPKTRTKTSRPEIELYQRENCPHSHAVRSKLSELSLDFVAHSVSEDAPLKHEQLVQAGGKDEVPFLMDHSTGTKLYDAQAIVAYLDAHYGKKTTNGIPELLKLRGQEMAWAIKQPWEMTKKLGKDGSKIWAEIKRYLPKPLMR